MATLTDDNALDTKIQCRLADSLSYFLHVLVIADEDAKVGGL